MWHGTFTLFKLKLKVIEDVLGTFLIELANATSYGHRAQNTKGGKEYEPELAQYAKHILKWSHQKA